MREKVFVALLVCVCVCATLSCRILTFFNEKERGKKITKDTNEAPDDPVGMHFESFKAPLGLQDERQR